MNEFDDANETLEQLDLLIGKENARKVFDFFKGSAVYFPKRIGLIEQHRNIFSELNAGYSYAELAQKYGYTKSYIRKIERKMLNEKRALSKKGIAPHKISQPATATPQAVQVLHSRPFEKGELFYEFDE